MDLAFKMFSKMSARSLQPDVISCNTAMRAASSSRHWQLGLAFLDGAEVDVISYTSCMNCCQGHLWQVSLAFWDLIQIVNFEPSSRAFNSAIHALRAEWTVAHQIFQEMLASGTSADPFTLSSLVHTSWELSFNARSMGLAGIDGAACNALLDSGPWTVGLEILEEMQLARIYVGRVGYTALGRAIGSLHWSQGGALLSQMRRMEARPLPLKVVIGFFGKVLRCRGTAAPETWRLAFPKRVTGNRLARHCGMWELPWSAADVLDCRIMLVLPLPCCRP